MISLVNTLKELADRISSLSWRMSDKAEKEWEFVGKAVRGNKTVYVTIDDYSEIMIVYYFGGLIMNSVFTPKVLKELGRNEITVDPGYYSGVIYVSVTKTSINIDSHTTGYTPDMLIYGKK